MFDRSQRRLLAAILPAGLLVPALLRADDEVPLKNWSAPPYWSPGPARPDPSEGTGLQKSARAGSNSVAANGAVHLPFVALPPCRLIDTRAASGFPFGYGPPPIPSGAQRSFPITGQCGVPSDAQAVSFNFTVWAPVTRGDLRVFPTGGGTPTVSTLNWEANILAIANAAIAPLGTGGAITVQVDGTGTIDLIVDVNGYYSPLGVVNSVNGLTGDVTLVGSSTVTITPGVGTLTFTSTIGPGGALPTGSSGQTLRSDGSSWLASSALTNDGTNVNVSGNVGLPLTTAGAGQLWWGGGPFLHVYGPWNIFLGTGSGNFTVGGWDNVAMGGNTLSALTSGFDNAAFGSTALHSNSSGYSNTAVGRNSLTANTTASFNTAVGAASAQSNTIGTGNTAVGAFSLASNTTASKNTAVGTSALGSQSYNNGGAVWDSENTAVGFEALYSNDSISADYWGMWNTAVGSGALRANTNGCCNTAVGQNALFQSAAHGNIAIGHRAGYSHVSGDDNIYIGRSVGQASEAFTIRIGGNSTRAFIAGIRGVTTANNNALPVLIDSAGQLGTASSSIRFKEDVRDMADASARIMHLRPVTFRYKAHRVREHATQFGLIAEEVEAVMPELVVRSADGEVETVKYHELPAMLLNELQKAVRRIEELEREVASLRAAGPGVVTSR